MVTTVCKMATAHSPRRIRGMLDAGCGLVGSAFLAAAIMEMVVFAFVDPLDVHWLAPLDWSRQAITRSLFAFWVVT
jgi:hypothetical protein